MADRVIKEGPSPENLARLRAAASKGAMSAFEKIDCRVRSKQELAARLAVPIDARLVNKKEGVDFINITTMKDILDARCGKFNWHVQIVPNPQPTIGVEWTGKAAVAGAIYTMIVSLGVRYLDEDGDPVWAYQHGTGTERLYGSKIFGDPLTNAYAQAVRRAAESHGLARELWRRDKETKKVVVIRAQYDAVEALEHFARAASHNVETHDDLPASVNVEEEEAHDDDGEGYGGDGVEHSALGANVLVRNAARDEFEQLYESLRTNWVVLGHKLSDLDAAVNKKKKVTGGVRSLSLEQLRQVEASVRGEAEKKGKAA
jgi:hypothetical protein